MLETDKTYQQLDVVCLVAISDLSTIFGLQQEELNNAQHNRFLLTDSMAPKERA
ncbi:hypothetical protein ACA081_00635 [Candidatus Hodgkinia cicadicola]